MGRTQRMQLKGFVCLLGVLLLTALLMCRVFFSGLHRDEAAPEQEPDGGLERTAAAQEFSNVWILEADRDVLTVFREGRRETYPVSSQAAAAPERLREQLADLQLRDGAVTAVTPKTQKLNGRILSADERSIEVEGRGRLPVAEDCRGYRLCGSLQMCTPKDIPIGYAFTDLCIEDGKVCGILIVREEAMEKIRVLIRSAGSGQTGLFHSQLLLTADTDYTLYYGDGDDRQKESCAAGEEVLIGTDSGYFSGERVWVVPDALTGRVTLKNVSRSQGEPSYRGQIELFLSPEGIVAVNEVPLEEYLYGVVPSEMPASYPAEALKAQAVCARTYAYGHMRRAGYPQYGAHVDDSVSYQVYNNIREQESATAAVRDTCGLLLYTPQGEPAQTYYYSTSCGVGSDATVWKTKQAPDLPYLRSKSISRSAMTRTVAALSQGISLPENETGEELMEEEAFAAFISAVRPDDFEAQEGWYRWRYRVEELDQAKMAQALRERYAADESLVLTLREGAYVSRQIGELGAVRELSVEKRGPGGVAEELVIEAENGTYKVISEYNIRYVLNDKKSKAERQDGSLAEISSLLPSGFFVLSTGKEGENVVAYTVSGGGFGHGVGMSQNGARRMAMSGFTGEEILSFFFQGCELRKVYE